MVTINKNLFPFIIILANKITIFAKSKNLRTGIDMKVLN